MAVYIKPLTMIDAAGYQATHDDDMPVLNTDDPDTLALTVGAASGTALPAAALYMAYSTETAVSFLRVGAADNQLADATHMPIGPSRGFAFRVGAGVTHIHAGSGA